LFTRKLFKGVKIYGCVMSIGLGHCFKSSTMVHICNAVTEFAVRQSKCRMYNAL